MTHPLTPRGVTRIGTLILGVILFGALFLQTLGRAPTATAQACGSGSGIQGVVYRDYDASGAQDGREPGQAGVTVTAFDSSGAIIGTAASDANGAFALSSIADASNVRLEFSSGATGLYPGGNSMGQSHVQFATAPQCDISFGVNNPAHYCQDNPDMALSCFVNGDPLAGGTSGAADWFVRHPYDPSANEGLNEYVADGTMIGSTWGTAYQRSSEILFAAAFMKRHSGFGTLGTGGIYSIDFSGATPVITEFVDLDSDLSIDTGADPRVVGDLTANMVDGNNDPNAFDTIGKVGLGNIAMSDDETTLWVMNLFDKTLYEINVGVPAVKPTAGDVTAHALATPPSCTAGEWRPMATTFYDGMVYIGGVCSGENSGATSADLHAYIYAHEPAGVDGNFTLVFDFALDYDRGYVSSGSPQVSANWLPWIDEWSDIGPPMPLPGAGPWGQTIYPQPMLSDIEFDSSGAMIVAIMDRAGHQLGNENYSTTNGDTVTHEGAAGGDVLRICNTASGFALENNGSCDGVTTSGAGSSPAQGPGGGEYYWQDMYPVSNDKNSGTHDEIAMGGMATLPGYGEVATVAMDPVSDYRAGGTIWLGHDAGNRVRSYEVFGRDAGGQPATFGKAAGLGEPELLCNAAPVEIGNRIWIDTDGDGIQDPGEASLAGVTVELLAPNGSSIGTVVTDSNGHYMFSNGDGTDTLNALYGLSAMTLRTANYRVRVDLNQAALAGYSLTDANMPDTGAGDGGSNADARDSDGTTAGDYAVADFNIGVAGENDHAYDFGFVPAGPTSIAFGDGGAAGLLESPLLPALLLTVVLLAVLGLVGRKAWQTRDAA